ncbi:MAG: OmpH family outer membrane protein [Candidatus Omnitrophica bacterium]|nr:OmpH family outer membrane protein [Candidatus Omnitrophota bacterium]
MKKLWCLVIAFLFLAAAQQCFAEDMKIGYINLGKIFEGYKKVTDSNVKLEEQKKKVQAKLDAMKELQNGFDTLSNEAKEERKNQMLAQQKEIQAMTYDVRKEEDRILREILKDIENISQDVQKKKKFSFILDDRLIIAGPKEMDLTDEVVKLLNERYKGK